MEPRANNGDAAATNPGDEPTDPIVAEDVELELLDRGLDAAARSALVDVRAFLEQLRRRSSSDEAAR